MTNLKPGRRKTTVVKEPDCEVPNKPGLYRFVNDRTGDVEYVGQTKDLRRRLQQYARDGKLDLKKRSVDYSARRLSRDDLVRIEKEYIV